MKTNKPYFIFLLFIISCGDSSYQDLNTLFDSKGNCINPVTMTEYVIGDEFCSISCFLNSDSTYSKEKGCEGNSKIEVGTWKINGDTIILLPTPKEKVNILARLAFSKIYNKKRKTTLIVKDKEFKPVEDFIVISFDNSNNLKIKKQYQYFETDKNGQITFEYGKYDSLLFPKLISKTNKIKVALLPDTIEMTLDINARAIMYGDFIYSVDNNEKRFLKTDSTLNDGNIILKRIDRLKNN